MNWAHIHLILNHVPVLGSMFVVFLLMYGIVRKKSELLRLSYLVMILVGLVSVAVYFTGEPAEEMIEHLAGVEESYIEAHEDVASYGFILTEVLAVLGGIGIYAFDRRPRLSRFVLRAAIILSLLNMAVMAYVANLGGKIRHTEIRGPSSDVAPSENED